MLSPDLQRIEHIRSYCIEIEKTVRRYGASFEIFDTDADYQRSVSFCIFQIGELSTRLSEAFKQETADRIPWTAIKGMRNLVVHSYGSVDRAVVWETAISDIPALKTACDAWLS